MPELPDVERWRRLLDVHLRRDAHHTCEVIDGSVVRNRRPSELESFIRGGSFRRVDRRGKWLVARTDGSALVVHFGMTGSFVVASRGDPRDRADRLAIIGTDSELRYHDVRKLGGIWMAADSAGIEAIAGALGPDAATVTATELGLRLRARRGTVKSVLLDQRVIAGLGNMLSDEVLWRAGVDPRRPARGLADDEVVRVHAALRDSLRRSIRAGRIPRTASWLASQRAADEPVCPRCDADLQRRTIAGRTSLWCPQCQGGASAVTCTTDPAS